VALSSWHCPSLLAGTLYRLSTLHGWPSSASFLFWWQNHSSSCKHLDYAVPCFLSCCSLNLEFTSLHRRRLGTEFGGTKNHMTSVSWNFSNQISKLRFFEKKFDFTTNNSWWLLFSYAVLCLNSNPTNNNQQLALCSWPFLDRISISTPNISDTCFWSCLKSSNSSSRNIGGRNHGRPGRPSTSNFLGNVPCRPP